MVYSILGQIILKYFRRSLITITLLAIGFQSFAQSLLEIPLSPFNDEIIRHSAYVLGYSEEHEQARWVAYQLTSEEVSGSQKRTDNFRSDPNVSTGSASKSDYKGSGYDRGHLAPAADMKLNSTYMSESFFMSNMSPQDPGFNRGIWKSLESAVRNMAFQNQAVYVVTGPIFESNRGSIGSNRVTIPGYYFKVILDYSGDEHKAIGFILPHSKSASSLSSFAVSVDVVENRTGLDFFPSIPDVEEEDLESEYDFSDWNIKDASSNFSSSGKQCLGTTKAGLRCKRNIKVIDTFCYQHKPNYSPKPKAPEPSAGIRCSATTKKGSQCKRKSSGGSIYCWQHK
jgi:endonuclease G, mitochondrial